MIGTPGTGRFSKVLEQYTPLRILLEIICGDRLASVKDLRNWRGLNSVPNNQEGISFLTGKRGGKREEKRGIGEKIEKLSSICFFCLI